MKKDIVGLLGLAGSGKGTVADILKMEGYEKLAFADSVKDAVSVIFHWPRELLEGDTEESRDFRETVDLFWSRKFNSNITPRIILQQFGTNCMRDNLLESIWIDSLERKLYDYDKVVISDVRFDNEMEFIKSSGGKLVCINRESPVWYRYIEEQLELDKTFDVVYYMKSYYPQVHISEWGWVGNSMIDIWINNDKTKKELYEKIVDQILN